MQKASVGHWLTAVSLLLATTQVLGQTSTGGAVQLPSAEQLLNIPLAGNPINNEPPPAIANPYANDRNAVVQGEALFNAMNCSGCHAAEGGGGMGPPLSDQHWIYGGAPADIYLTLQQGRPNGMPAFGRVLPPQSLWQLAAYVQSLGTPGPATLNAESAPGPQTVGKPASPQTQHHHKSGKSGTTGGVRP